MHPRSWLWVSALFLGGSVGVALPGSAAAWTYPGGHRRPVPVAAPMGLLEFCEERPETCAVPGQGHPEVLDAVRQARRIAWSERLAARPAAGWRKPAVQRPFDAAEGRSQTSKPAFLGRLTPAVSSSDALDLGEVSDLNATVNRAVRPMSDQRLHGRPDVWTLPIVAAGGRLAGDCEDIVLAKRDALIQAGVDPAHLSIALAVTPSGEDHAVLLLARPEGDFVLDNLDGRILHWSQVDLRWQARQIPGNMLSWIRL